jgi:hypothetical protein
MYFHSSCCLISSPLNPFFILRLCISLPPKFLAFYHASYVSGLRTSCAPSLASWRSDEYVEAQGLGRPSKALVRTLQCHCRSSKTKFQTTFWSSISQSDFKNGHISENFLHFPNNSSNLVGNDLFFRIWPQLHFMNNFSRTRFVASKQKCDKFSHIFITSTNSPTTYSDSTHLRGCFCWWRQSKKDMSVYTHIYRDLKGALCLEMESYEQGYVYNNSHIEIALLFWYCKLHDLLTDWHSECSRYAVSLDSKTGRWQALVGSHNASAW